MKSRAHSIISLILSHNDQPGTARTHPCRISFTEECQNYTVQTDSPPTSNTNIQGGSMAEQLEHGTCQGTNSNIIWSYIQSGHELELIQCSPKFNSSCNHACKWSATYTVVHLLPVRFLNLKFELCCFVCVHFA